MKKISSMDIQFLQKKADKHSNEAPIVDRKNLLPLVDSTTDNESSTISPFDRHVLYMKIVSHKILHRSKLISSSGIYVFGILIVCFMFWTHMLYYNREKNYFTIWYIT